MDVQGAEYEVLKNLKSFDIKPKFIVYEDDRSLSKGESITLEKLLKNEGYFFVTGSHDKLWMRIWFFILLFRILISIYSDLWN